jgi:hypothetical protein
MQAGAKNLLINKKASFQFDFYVLDVYDKKLPVDDAGQTPRDLTGATISAKAKAKIGDTANLFTFTASIPEPTKGHCRLELSAAQTSAMAWTQGVWDVLVTYADGKVDKFLEGNLNLEKTAS